MDKPITLVEELMPRIKEKSEFDITPKYLNYISDLIDEATDRADKILNVDQFINPAYIIKNIFKNNRPLDIKDIKEIEYQLNQIKKIQAVIEKDLTY